MHSWIEEECSDTHSQQCATLHFIFISSPPPTLSIIALYTNCNTTVFGQADIIKQNLLYVLLFIYPFVGPDFSTVLWKCKTSIIKEMFKTTLINLYRKMQIISIYRNVRKQACKQEEWRLWKCFSSERSKTEKKG